MTAVAARYVRVSGACDDRTDVGGCGPGRDDAARERTGVTAPPVKRFLNDPEHLVRESLAGFAAAHADLVRVDLERQLVIRRDAPVTDKVGVLSGGGSGHEP